jgi:hypothetical protein
LAVRVHSPSAAVVLFVRLLARAVLARAVRLVFLGCWQSVASGTTTARRPAAQVVACAGGNDHEAHCTTVCLLSCSAGASLDAGTFCQNNISRGAVAGYAVGGVVLRQSSVASSASCPRRSRLHNRAAPPWSCHGSRPYRNRWLSTLTLQLLAGDVVCTGSGRCDFTTASRTFYPRAGWHVSVLYRNENVPIATYTNGATTHSASLSSVE